MIPASSTCKQSRIHFDTNCLPPFELIQQFCEDMSAFLKANDRNVAVVHCCDGVQRAGVMICSYLLHDQIFYSTLDALQFFAAARTHDGVGIVHSKVNDVTSNIMDT